MKYLAGWTGIVQIEIHRHNGPWSVYMQLAEEGADSENFYFLARS